MIDRSRAPLPQSPAAVRWARKAKGWSLRSFAREVGVSHSHLSEMETGKRPAPHVVLVQMARVLGCPVSILQAHCSGTCLLKEDDPDVTGTASRSGDHGGTP